MYLFQLWILREGVIWCANQTHKQNNRITIRFSVYFKISQVTKTLHITTCTPLKSLSKQTLTLYNVTWLSEALNVLEVIIYGRRAVWWRCIRNFLRLCVWSGRWPPGETETALSRFQANRRVNTTTASPSPPRRSVSAYCAAAGSLDFHFLLYFLPLCMLHEVKRSHFHLFHLKHFHNPL